LRKAQKKELQKFKRLRNTPGATIVEEDYGSYDFQYS